MRSIVAAVLITVELTDSSPASDVSLIQRDVVDAYRAAVATRSTSG